MKSYFNRGWYFINTVDTNETLEKLIKENEMVLAYFGSKSCSVCNVMKPKLEKILKSYPKIKSFEVNVQKSQKTAAAYNVFTIPAILVFIDGKETIREARYISIQEINNKISRYYNLLYEQ